MNQLSLNSFMATGEEKNSEWIEKWSFYKTVLIYYTQVFVADWATITIKRAKAWSNIVWKSIQVYSICGEMIEQSREQIPVQKRVTMTIDSGQERLRKIFKLYFMLVLGNIQACKTNPNDLKTWTVWLNILLTFRQKIWTYLLFHF